MEKLPSKEIRQLRRLLGKAREALEPFAKMAEGKDSWPADGGCAQFPTVRVVRYAAAVLNEIEESKLAEDDLFPYVEGYLAAVEELGRTKRRGTSTVNDIHAAEDDVDTTLDAVKKLVRKLRKRRKAIEETEDGEVE